MWRGLKFPTKRRGRPRSFLWTACSSLWASCRRDVYDGLLKTDAAGYIEASEDGVTSVKGVFAAGDVRTKQLRQVITAVSDGANCITSVERYLAEQ